MKKLIKITLKLVLLIVVFLGLFLGYMTLADFKPDEKIELLSNTSPSIIKENDFSVLIWNIGYAGLGSDMDFFYDGGQQVRTSEENTLENYQNISSFLSSQSNIDFFLLQEVDVNAKRTYGINLRDSLENLFPDYLSLYADNYLVDFVPVPVTEPMGSVKAGLQTISKYIPNKSTRFAFPGNFSWPTALFSLDRCFISNRYQLKNGKELVIINTHNSAFDDGSLKKQQLDYLKLFLEKEIEKGNYFVVGGDWNQTPPQFDNSKFGSYADSKKYILTGIDENLFPKEWKWVFDPNVPTNRSTIKPYVKGENSTSVIDYFLVSPNVTPKFVTTIDLDFQNSDHQPVIMKFKLD